MIMPVLLLALSHCTQSPAPKADRVYSKADLTVDTTGIPRDTISAVNKALTTDAAGILYYNNQLFSGVLNSVSNDSSVYSFTSILNGKKQGIYRSFYHSRKPFEVRLFNNGLATGRHYGYWENGKIKFDYLYFNEKKIGYFKKWYPSGQPYLFSNYKEDSEDGLEQGWRENGKLFLNYVVKDGYRYGLQQSALCYTLKDQKIKDE